MNQNYNDIGLALLRDYNDRVAALSAGWEPDVTGILHDGWGDGMTNPGVPELLDTVDRVSRLVESLTSGLVPPDLVGNGFAETSGTGQGNREIAFGSAKTTTTTQSAPLKNQWNKPEDVAPYSTISPKTEDPKTARNMPAQPGTEPARLIPIPIFSDNDTEPSGNTAGNATGQKPNGMAASPAAGRSEPSAFPGNLPSGDQEFRPLGKLNDVGNYREFIPPQLPETAAETNEAFPPANIKKESDAGLTAFYGISISETTANQGGQNNSGSGGSSKSTQNADHKQKQADPQDLDIIYEELTRKIHDEYKRFYED